MDSLTFCQVRHGVLRTVTLNDLFRHVVREQGNRPSGVSEESETQNCQWTRCALSESAKIVRKSADPLLVNYTCCDCFCARTITITLIYSETS